MPNRIRITEETAISQRLRLGIHWDKPLPGFGLRVGDTKQRHFVQTQLRGKDIKVTLGRVRMSTHRVPSYSRWVFFVQDSPCNLVCLNGFRKVEWM